MRKSVLVQIVSAPIACAEGTKDTWREVSAWTAGQLKARFGDEVQVKYYNLFDGDCPPMPVDAKLPLVLVDGKVLTSGGKISVPVLRKKIETILNKQVA
jgi:hypothetical protein